MQIVLFIWLLLLFYISYFLTGKDFFAPSTMLALAFAFACILSIYILSDLNYSIGIQTVVIIGSCLTVSLLIGLAVHDVFKRSAIPFVEEKASPIPEGFTIIVLIVMAITIYSQLNMIHRVSGTSGTFAHLMTLFRNANGYSTNTDAQYPFGLRLLLNFSQAMFYVYAFNLLKFFKQLKKSSIIIQVFSIFLIVFSGLLTGGRFSLLTNIIAIVFMYHMIRIQRLGKYKTYRFSFLIRITILVIAAAWLFYAIKEFVGRVSDDSLFDYTAHYIGTGIINLDLYFENPPSPSNIWGKETFYSIINALRRLGILDVESYIFHKEFRRINGVSMGNIYTAFRDYHYDFGMVGVYILHLFFSCFFSIIYEYVKKRRTNLQIILVSMMYYCIVLYMYNQFFYTNIIAFGFAIRIVLVYVLYTLLIRKRFKIRIRHQPAAKGLRII